MVAVQQSRSQKACRHKKKSIELLAIEAHQGKDAHDQSQQSRCQLDQGMELGCALPR